MTIKSIFSYICLIVVLLIISWLLQYTRFNAWVIRIDPKALDFYKSVGTVFAVLMAAIIAALIQYQQWKTARIAVNVAHKKLKLDLFEHRYEIFNGITTGLLHMSEGTYTSEQDRILFLHVQKLRWVFDEEILDLVKNKIVLGSSTFHENIRKIMDSEEEYTGKDKELSDAKEAFWEYQRPYLAERNKLLSRYMKISEDVQESIN